MRQRVLNTRAVPLHSFARRNPHGVLFGALLCLSGLVHAGDFLFPRGPTMFSLHLGRSTQGKNYQQASSSALRTRTVSAWNAGLYLNPLHTPFHSLPIPFDILLGYEFTLADPQLLIESTSETLQHRYYCNYLSGGLLLNLLPFADICLLGGVGIAHDDFRHAVNGNVYDYLNGHGQAYIMPGLESFYSIRNTGLHVKIGVYAKKALIAAWDLNIATLDRPYMLVDHTTAQAVVRATVGFGRHRKARDREYVGPDHVAERAKPRSTSSQRGHAPSAVLSTAGPVPMKHPPESYAVRDVSFYLTDGSVTKAALLYMSRDSIFTETQHGNGSLTAKSLPRDAFLRIVHPDGRDLNFARGECDPVHDSSCWMLLDTSTQPTDVSTRRSTPSQKTETGAASFRHPVDPCRDLDALPAQRRRTLDSLIDIREAEWKLLRNKVLERSLDTSLHIYGYEPPSSLCEHS